MSSSSGSVDVGAINAEDAGRNRRRDAHDEEACVKPGFEPGISEEMTVTTTPDMGITHLGPGVPQMYSTPAMVGLIEGTCVRLITRFVEPGEQSVGFRIDVKHLAPTQIGNTVSELRPLRTTIGVFVFGSIISAPIFTSTREDPFSIVSKHLSEQ